MESKRFDDGGLKERRKEGRERRGSSVSKTQGGRNGMNSLVDREERKELVTYLRSFFSSWERGRRGSGQFVGKGSRETEAVLG